MGENYFNDLYQVPLTEEIKQKNGLKYVPWAVSWAEVKKRFPDAEYRIYPMTFHVSKVVGEEQVTYDMNRPWHDDGKTGWVQVGVTICGIEYIETLPVLDLKNKPVAADAITSADANKAIQRALTKACARHGMGLFVYKGEDLPDDLKEIEKKQGQCFEMIEKKCKSEKLKDKVAAICKEILPEENGNPKNCNDIDRLNELYTKLRNLR